MIKIQANEKTAPEPGLEHRIFRECSHAFAGYAIQADSQDMNPSVHD